MKSSSEANDALEQLLDFLRYRRAWVRYLLHLHLAEGKNSGFFAQTISTTSGSVIPTWDTGKPNWLEKGPYPGSFPSGYEDRLLTGVRWRVMGLRSITADRFRPRKGGKTIAEFAESPDGKTIVGKKLVRVWEEEWPRQMTPGRSRLKRVGLTTDAQQDDYLRLWAVINGLDDLHRKLLAQAHVLQKTFEVGTTELEKALREYGLPAPPF